MWCLAARVGALGVLCGPAARLGVAATLGRTVRSVACTRAPSARLPRARAASRGRAPVEEAGTARATQAQPDDPRATRRRGRRSGSARPGRSSTSATSLRADAEAALPRARAEHRPPVLLRREAAPHRAELALERQAFPRRVRPTLALWRLSAVRAALSFVEALLDHRASSPSSTARSATSSRRTARRHATAADRRHEGRASRIEVSEPHRGCLEDLEGFSHVWVLAHLHETTAGTHGRAVPRRPPHGTFATRSPHRPNRSGSRSPGSSRSSPSRRRRRRHRPARRDTRARPEAVRPALRHPREDVRSGWFEGRAERVFERRVRRPLLPAEPSLRADSGVGETNATSST